MKNNMILRDWLEKNRKKIDHLDAELILMRAIRERFNGGVPDRSWLVAHDETEMADAERLSAEKMLQRRQAGEPIAYILGEKEFFGRKFEVNKNVLIPRPETEEVVELVLELMDKEGVEEGVQILEVGTGSGCIATTLALERPSVKVVAVDISKDALDIAKRNAQNLGAKVEFLQSDLLDKVPENEEFKIVVANLPYVDEEWAWLDRETLDFEPKIALFAEENGLRAYRRLLGQLTGRKATKWAVFEADPCQHEEIAEIANGNGFQAVKKRGFGVVLKRRAA